MSRLSQLIYISVTFEVKMRFHFISFIALMACRNELGVKEFNSLPSIQIISHGDGSTFDEGIMTTLISQSSDNNHDATSLITNWYADDQELCIEVPVAADGLSSCDALIPFTASVIRAAVRDPENGGGEDDISIIVIENIPPSADIVTPLDNETYSQNEFIPFEAIMTDAEDAPEDLSYTLESDLDGPLDNSVIPDSSGSFELGLTLSPGAHRVSLTVTDSGGKTATDSVGFTVTDINSPPSCGILSPTDGAELSGASLSFSGNANDIDQNDTDLSVIWTSSLDGVINTSNPTSNGDLNFEALLTSGAHVIALEVTDNDGATCTDEINLVFSSGPEIAILAPLDGTRVNIGEPIDFEAQISNLLDPADDLLVKLGVLA